MMPIMPFMYILTATAVKKWVQSNSFKKFISLKLGRKVKLGLVYALTIWFLADVAIAYPFYLSYYNEFVGTEKVWKYVTDSHYDWGKALK